MSEITYDSSSNSKIWIRTYSGQKLFYYHPKVENIEIIDIAHGLSNLCRYNGQVKSFYSVAQHSVLVCQASPESLKLAALLHDATEAYIGDMVRPLKERNANFQSLEDNLFKCICEKFKIKWDAEIHKRIKYYDNSVLAAEVRDLVNNRSDDKYVEEPPIKETIYPLLPGEARELFLQEFYKHV